MKPPRGWRSSEDGGRRSCIDLPICAIVADVDDDAGARRARWQAGDEAGLGMMCVVRTCR